jgi:hypothetical protein
MSVTWMHVDSSMPSMPIACESNVRMVAAAYTITLTTPTLLEVTLLGCRFKIAVLGDYYDA